MDAKAKSQPGKWTLTIVFGTMIVLALSLIGQQAQLIWDGATICKGMETNQERIVIPIPGRPGDIYFHGQKRFFMAATSKQAPACYADPSLLDNDKLADVSQAVAEALHMQTVDVQNIILSKRDTTYRWLKKNITQEELEAVADLNLPRVIPPEKIEEASQQVATILKMDVEPVRAALIEKRGSKLVWIKKDLSEDEVAAINDLKTKKGFKGVRLEYLWVRDYPNHSLASTTLGFQNKAGVGAEGLESVLFTWLSPHAGVRENLGDSGRRQLAALSDVQPKDGCNVFLTIDPVIQDKLEKALNKAHDQFGAEWVVGVMMDPHTGEILAMYSTPGFDPSHFNEVANPIERQNRCLCAPYEPGSAFKPLIASIAIDNNMVTWNTMFECNGSFNPPNGGTVKDHGSSLGSINFADVLIHSSNIGMAKLGLMMGKKAVYQAVRMFGIGDRVGIQLPDAKHWPGESGGIVRSLRDWDSFSLPRVPFGQEVAVTALQLTNAYCAIANGGELLQPRLVDCITDAKGKEVWKSERKVTRRVIKEQTSRAVLDVLAGVVEKEYGTGHATTQMEKWTSFGKTGTAQVAKAGQLAAGVYTGSFVGGAPVSNPRVILLVSVNHPTKGGYYGGTVAGPAWKEVMEGTLSYLNVKPDRTEPIKVKAGAERSHD